MRTPSYIPWDPRNTAVPVPQETRPGARQKHPPGYQPAPNPLPEHGHQGPPRTPDEINQTRWNAGALLSTPIPLAGDAIGLGADAHMYRTDPSSHTPGNYLLTGVGAVAPVIPGASVARPALDKLKGFFRPMEAVSADLGAVPVGRNIDEFSDFMLRQRDRGEITPRQFAKAYLITRASIQRAGRPTDSFPDVLRAADEGGGVVRPEDAYAQWLMSPTGERMLTAAERGQVDIGAVDEIVKMFQPFGMQNALRADVETLVPRAATVADSLSQLVKNDASAEEVMAFIRGNVPGVGAAKTGFLMSMLGYGKLPTFDARQIGLHVDPEQAGTFKRRMEKKAAGQEGMAELSRRQEQLLPEVFDVYGEHGQHLAHHAIWDKLAGEHTRHSSITAAMEKPAIAAMMVAPVAAVLASLRADRERQTEQIENET